MNIKLDNCEQKISWVCIRHYNCNRRILSTLSIRYFYVFHKLRVPSWSWSHGIRIYTYLCNQYLSQLKLWVRIPPIARGLDTALCDKVCQGLAIGRHLSSGTPVSSINKTDHHDITAILLEMALSTTFVTLHKLTNVHMAVNVVCMTRFCNKLLTNKMKAK